MILAVLTLIAVPGVMLNAEGGTPAATAAACTPVTPADPVSDSHVRQQVILDEMRGHLLVSLALWQAGNYPHATVHAAHPADKLIPVITGDLRRACLLDGLTKALTGYIELASKAGDKANVEKSHGAILAMLDQASAGMISPGARGDAGFNFRVIAGLLADAQKEYAESFKDGKIVEVLDYQDSVGFYQAARARYDAIKPALAKSIPDLDKSLEPNWQTLADALKDVNPPEKPADPKSIADAVANLSSAGAKALNITLETKLTPIEYLNNAQHDLAEALALYEKGESDAAYEEAASAYLDQYENAEVALAAKDKELMETIEGQMKDFRDAIKAGKPVDEVKAILAKINPNIEKAIALLSE
jgi:putative sterol carrier protein